MDKLIKFEQKFDKPNEQWTKAQWREVALHFAGIEHTETSRKTKSRGRKTKTANEIYNDEQNFSAAEFWRDEAMTKISTSKDGVVFEVSERTKWNKLSKSSANKIILADAIKRDVQEKEKEKKEEKADKKEKKPPTLSALTKSIQENQKKMREK